MKIDGHFGFSILKSALRILAGVVLIFGDYVMAGGLLIAAELFGIIEEMV
jgi:hypothetical protein